MSGSPIDWTTDTKEEHMKATALLVEKLDVISIHPYGLGGTDEFAYRGEDGEPVRCSFDFYMEVANRLGKVLYNGETNSRASIDDPDFNSQSEAYLNDIITPAYS